MVEFAQRHNHQMHRGKGENRSARACNASANLRSCIRMPPDETGCDTGLSDWVGPGRDRPTGTPANWSCPMVVRLSHQTPAQLSDVKCNTQMVKKKP